MDIESTLVSANSSHIRELMTWFDSEPSLKQWSGPNFRYPYTLKTFTEDLRLAQLDSFALVDENERLLAFGQYYLRLDKCHLGRLVVNPKLRGKGIAQRLIALLSAKGKSVLAVESCSLFVLANNKSALHCYQKLGFQLTKYPEKMVIEHCLYMVR